MRHLVGMRERTNCERGCSFSFFIGYKKDYTKTEEQGQEGLIKTCRNKQHARIGKIFG